MKKITFLKNSILMGLLLITTASHASLPMFNSISKTAMIMGTKGRDLPNQHLVFKSGKSEKMSTYGLNQDARPMRVRQEGSTMYQLDSLIMRMDGSDNMYFKINCVYDSIGRMILYSIYEYDANIGKLHNKYTYKYGNNYLIKDEYEDYGSEINFMRTKTTFDEKGRIQYVYNTRDSLDTDVLSKTTEYIYINDRINEIKEFYNYYDLKEKKTIFYYDESGRDTAEVTSRLDARNNEWSTESKTLHYYDALNRDTMEIGYSYGRLNSKTLYSYDNRGNIINSKEFTSNGTVWKTVAVKESEYNKSNDCVIYNESYNYGIDSVKQTYQTNYDESTPKTNVRYGYIFEDFPYSFHSKMETIVLQSMGPELSNTTARYTFHYSEVNKNTGGISTMTTGQDVVHYNSRAKRLELFNSSNNAPYNIHVFNANGSIVVNKYFSEGFIDLPHLSKGVYLYKLINNNQTLTGKFVAF